MTNWQWREGGGTESMTRARNLRGIKWGKGIKVASYGMPGAVGTRRLLFIALYVIIRLGFYE